MELAEEGAGRVMWWVGLAGDEVARWEVGVRWLD